MQETQINLAYLLVFIRAILYPVVAFLLLVFAYSGNRKKAKMFGTHILIASMFMILGLMAVVRLALDSSQIITNIGNFVITPMLVLLGLNLARHAVREEKSLIAKAKEGIPHDQPC